MSRAIPVIPMMVGVLFGELGIAAEKPHPPNVLFISVDDMDDWIGCLGGHPDAKTPNIDRLARRGVLFTNAAGPKT